MTAKRAAVLKILNESEGHLTAEDIFRRIRKEHPGIVLATVYNNLHALSDQGLVRRIPTEDGADFYDRTPTPHDHAHCTVCGKLFDLPNVDIKPFLEESTALSILSYQLTVHSVCAECQKIIHK